MHADPQGAGWRRHDEEAQATGRAGPGAAMSEAISLPLVTPPVQREEYRWWSPALEREMALLVFGHAGPRVLAFPTSEGRYVDWEGFGLVDALREVLAAGELQLVCVDSVDTESWYAAHNPPALRVRRHLQYDAYLHDEVVPFSATLNPESPLLTAGCSLGAYHAVTFALRHPELVTGTLGMSGLYDISRFTRGYAGADLDSVNPVAIVAAEEAAERLAALRRLEIILAVGDEPLRASNTQLSKLLWDKGIPHQLHASDAWIHDWPSWAEMLHLYLAGAERR